MNQLKSKIEKVILQHFSSSSVHGLKNNPIPSKKLENVKSLHNIKNEKVLFIYDATLFGSAKDGMVFTERGIYWREVLDSPQQLDYRELIESTANKYLPSKLIFILDQDEKIKLKETYNKFICDLRSELINSSIIYETYYKSALASATDYLARLLKTKEFGQIIEWLNKYEGLFLRSQDKSVKLREISFQAYLKVHMFPKAQEELGFIEGKNPRFYRKAAPLLELAIKEADFESLGQARLQAMEQEEYDLAFSILENQKQLGIREAFEIEKIRKTVEQSKRRALTKYQEKLNKRLEDEDLLAAEQIIEQIYKIEAAYPLEKEKILLIIYRYDLERAKEEISQLSDSILQLELKNILQEVVEKRHKKIRNAVINKEYDIFDKHPDIWYDKDEYGMCALDYFALEADLEGILKALDHLKLLLMPANIFGHNFIDLIGFACDPNLGNNKGNPLEILEKIKSKIDFNHIDDRINFLKTGQEGYFFSYKLSQEDRLSQLNQKLMSPDHFKQILIEIENQTNNNVDRIIRHLFSRELEAMASYPAKDEFETSHAYKKRCKAFKQQYLDQASFIAEYKKQNQPMVEGITKLLEDKKRCFIPDISAMVESKNKALGALKSLKSTGDILALLDLYFPIKDDVISVKLGPYHADREVFLMIVDGKEQELPMPLSIAKQYKKTFPEVEYIYRRVIEDGEVILKTTTKYGGQSPLH